jgi:hypothetical protein
MRIRSLGWGLGIRIGDWMTAVTGCGIVMYMYGVNALRENRMGGYYTMRGPCFQDMHFTPSTRER